MSKGLVNDSSLRRLADAIIELTGHNVPMYPSEMADELEDVHAYTWRDDGKVVYNHNFTVTLEEQTSTTFTSNGTYDTTRNNQVVVSVPNDYTAEDEGKVVNNATLTPQTSVIKTQNGTYDTTLNNQVVINVPNTYNQSDEGKVVSNAALVSQTSVTKTENGTYDTTLNNQVVVAVPDYDTEEW